MRINEHQAVKDEENVLSKIKNKNKRRDTDTKTASTFQQGCLVRNKKINDSEEEEETSHIFPYKRGRLFFSLSFFFFLFSPSSFGEYVFLSTSFFLVSVLSAFAAESKVLVCSVNVYLDNNYSGSVTRIDS